MGLLYCAKCGKQYSLDDKRWRCDCGGYLDIEFDAKVRFDKKTNTMWKYRDAIPIENESNIVSFDEGFTPLIREYLYGKEVYLKLDFLFPTGSYKDRGASVLVSKIKELGIKHVVEDSSGNAGSAIAAYCAKASIKCDIFVPESASSGKSSQIISYGASLHMIPGSRKDTSEAVMKKTNNLYYASHVWNPFFLQGIKTFSYELFEQLHFKVPDTLIIPTGNGTLFIGAYLGFNDLMKNGYIKSMPKFIAVQAENCAPLYKMFKDNLNYVPTVENRPTIAEGIAINNPLRGKQILEIVKSTSGSVVAVSDKEIKEALLEIFKIGIYIEPTSASVIAALKKGNFGKNETIVLPLTGFGLKTSEKIMHLLEEEK